MPGQPAPSCRKVAIPDYYKEFFDLLHSSEEYANAINMTRLVSTYRGKFDCEAWQRSVDFIMARHPVLTARVAAG